MQANVLEEVDPRISNLRITHGHVPQPELQSTSLSSAANVLDRLSICLAVEPSAFTNLLTAFAPVPRSPGVQTV